MFLIFWRYPLKHLYMKSFEIWFKRSICRESGDGKYMKYRWDKFAYELIHAVAGSMEAYYIEFLVLYLFEIFCNNFFLAY